MVAASEPTAIPAEVNPTAVKTAGAATTAPTPVTTPAPTLATVLPRINGTAVQTICKI